MTGSTAIAETKPGLHVLLSAFAADPLYGSERYVGWRWLNLLAPICERLVVLTREHNRPFHAGQAMPDNVELIYFDLPLIGTKIDHKHRFIKPYYVVWQLAALLHVAFKPQLRSVRIVQHVTYNVIDMPGFLWLLRGRKFVWGPVGGGQVPPAALKRVFGRKDWAKERLRAAMKAFTRWNPIVRGAARNADLVLFANEDTAARLQGLTRRSELMLETAIDADKCAAERSPPAEDVFPLLWLSHFDARKAFPLAVDALQLAAARCGRAIRLDVIGEGHTFESARALVAARGMSQQVCFHGKIPFDEVAGKMARAGAFLFSSVSDTSGNVVLEAMAAGTPVVALNHQGVRQMLANGGGILVDIGTYEETVSRFADAIVALATDARLWSEKSAEALHAIRHELNWDAKRDRMAELFTELL
jgi:glycosyltransferase involved in cell wall biosynthesis